MFRPFRLVMMIISISLTLGFVGLRTAAPAPNQAFGHIPDWQMNAGLKLYGMIYEFANNAPMPDVSKLMAGGLFSDGPRAPEVGRPGHSDSDMGRSLSQMRERTTGVKTGPISFGDIQTEIQKGVKSNMTGIGPSRSGPPKAEARRIVVGQ
ncbi:MAG: hypothetical protein AAGG09_08270 [Pseudomonadota bacterium]